MRDPQRLRDQADVARPLADALKLLEQQAPSADVLAHIERQLQALPASPTLGVLGQAKWLAIGALAVLGAVATVLWLRPGAVPARTSVSAAPAPLATNPVSSDMIASPTLPAPIPPQPSAAKPMPATRPRQPRPRSAHATPVAPKPHAVDVSEEVAVPAPERPVAERVEAIPPQSSAAEPQDEAMLLYRAKVAERNAPESALELLALHARSFPRGKLSEEREALTIRVQLRLGHEDDAARLARRFRERFPRSLYRITLPE